MTAIEDQRLDETAPASKRALFLIPLDLIAIAIGVTVLWNLAQAISNAAAFGEIQLPPKVRHDPPETVPWARAWAYLGSSGWLGAVFIRYLWTRGRSIILASSRGRTDLDVLLALSVVPMGAIRVFSGSLASWKDVFNLVVSVIVVAIPFAVGLRFGRRAAVAVIVLLAVVGFGFLLFK